MNRHYRVRRTDERRSATSSSTIVLSDGDVLVSNRSFKSSLKCYCRRRSGRAPGGGKNLAHKSILIGMGPSKWGLRSRTSLLRTKRAAADLAATGELIRGMPPGRELEQPPASS
jgi:hypothetical protein